MSGAIEIYLVQAMHGLVYGMLLFMVASGLCLVLGMMGILNMMHAGFYMLGAYLAYSLTLYLGSFWLSLLISPVIVGILGILIERFLVRKAHKSGHTAEILVTFGLYFMLMQLVRLVWGSHSLRLPEPTILAGTIPFMGNPFPVYRLFILALSLTVLIGMALLLTRTRIGILIRAAVSDADMVDALGTKVPTMFIGVFAGGAVLAAIAGVVSAPFLTIFSGMGDQVLLDCFVVVVVGGFGSLFGTFIASIMIGQLQSFGTLWIPQLALVLQFLLMAVVLTILPTGLFGEEK